MFLFSLLFAVIAAPVTFESGPSPTTLIELYTSEGCSSCPPAEARLAQFREAPDLWKSVVPVAFHVDYWDGLGWPDRFARPEFTQRQRNYAARWRAVTVSTPAFVLNGQASDGPTSKRTADPGVLRARVEPSGEVVVVFSPVRPPAGSLVAELAPLAGGIASDVRSGENAGRRLRHEFVALALVEAPFESRNGVWTAKLSLPGTSLPISALAVWVHSADNPFPLQATGGWLKK